MGSDSSQRSFTAGELASSLAARTDLAKYSTGLKTCLNFTVSPHGGVSTRSGFEFIAELFDSSKVARLVPFEFSTVQTYVLIFESGLIRVLKDGGTVVEAGKTITGITRANPAVVTSTAHGYANGDDLEISSITGMTELNGRRVRVASATTNTFALVGINSTNYAAYSSGGLAERVYTITTSYSETDLPLLNFTQSADTLFLVHPLHAPAKLTRTGHTTWTLTTITFAPIVTAPTGQTATPTGTGGTASTVTYKITAINDETGEESLPSAVATCTGWTEADWPITCRVQVGFGAVSYCTQYKVYKGDNGIYGFIGRTESLSFRDENIGPDVSVTPPGSRNPFVGAGNYPTVVSFYEQRLYFAATLNAPQTVWGSVVNSFTNLNVSRPAGADEAITFTVALGQVNEIRAICPLKSMILFSSSGEMKVSGSGDSAMTPGNVTLKPQSFRGSSRVRPLIVGDTILFVQNKGATVRDLAYQLQSDGFSGNDLSILSNHLFSGFTIIDWGYAQIPSSIVWAVRNDGVMLGLSYQREHEVWAWHRHATEGFFEAVVTISEGAEDAVYVVVKRTIGGLTRRYVERLHTRQFTAVAEYFGVDSGLTYSGAPTQTVSGLDHLEGKTVAILADGSVVTPAVVVAGKVTLPFSASLIHVGLGYSCDLESLNIDESTLAPGKQGARKAVSRVRVLVERSREFLVGPDAAHLTQTKMVVSAYNAEIAAYTGVQSIVMTPQWNNNGSIFLRVDTPIPVTVNALIPHVEMGG